MRLLRRDMQVVFQDPYSSLNPRLTVGAIIREGLDIHRVGAKGERRERVRALLREVGLDPQDENKYPHEFSGGQRQRVGIARALALEPKFIVCDEPVSALDVSIQAQIINLLRDLQFRHNLSYLFISHDLGVVRYVSHRVAVMYLGKIVEEAPASELYQNPCHPYTRALLSAIPVPDPARRTKREILSGGVPSLFNLPPGCRFHPRCRFAEDICRREPPPERSITPDHTVLCYRAESR
jgi:oligopeptide/dipeptide ABC transporter ATP-binding protein